MNSRRIYRSQLRAIAVTVVLLGAAALTIGLRPPGAAAKVRSHLNRLWHYKTSKAGLAKKREQFWASKLGLSHGVPKGARTHALEAMRNSALRSPAAGRLVQFSSPVPVWQFLGPQPITDELANFGGFNLNPGNAFLSSATGRIAAIASASGFIFGGAATGGLWMSTDDGATFTSISDNLPTTSIGAIALDTVNTSGNTPTGAPTIYVGTGEANGSFDSYYGAGLFVSNNLGGSWTSLPSSGGQLPNGGGPFTGVSFTRIAIDPSVNPPILLASVTAGLSAGRADQAMFETPLASNGIWRSSDGGATWTQEGNGTTVGGFPAFNSCQFLSTSGFPCPADDVAIDPLNPHLAYAAIDSDGIYTSTDEGASWSGSPIANFGVGQGRQTIAIGPNAGSCASGHGTTPHCGSVYVMIGASDAAEFRSVWFSSDGGVTWTKETVPSAPVGSPSPVTIDGTFANNDVQSFYDEALIVSPADPTEVFFGGIGPYQSNNNGGGWTFLASNGGTYADQHAFAFDANDVTDQTLLIGNDGGLWKYDIQHAQFTSLNTQIVAAQIQGIGPHPSDPTKVIAGFQDHGTEMIGSAQNQLPWTVVVPDDGGFALFDIMNPSFAYSTAATQGAFPQLQSSNNGGLTWDLVNPTNGITTAMQNNLDGGAVFYPPIASDPLVAKRVWVGGHFVYVSTDGLATFRVQSNTDLTDLSCSDGSCALEDLEFVPGTTRAWALAMANDLDYSVGNAGFAVSNTVQANCPDQPGCLSKNPGLFATWTDVTAKVVSAFTSPANQLSTQATGIAVDPNHPLVAYLSLSGYTAATTVGHIYKTSNFGTSWARADGDLPDVPVLRVLVDRTDATGNTLYAATDVGIFKSTNGGTNWVAYNGAIPPVPVFDLEQQPSGSGAIFAGTHGRGAYQLLVATPTATPKASPSVGVTATATPTATPSVGVTATATPAATATTILTAGPLALMFGNVNASAKSKDIKVTLTNKGSVAAQIESIVPPPPFAIDGAAANAGTRGAVAIQDTCSNNPGLAPKAHCSFDVMCSPATPETSVSETLTIPYNGTSPSVSLSCNPLAVILSAKPPHFPNTAAGADSKAVNISVKNPAKGASATLSTCTVSGNYIKGATDTCSGMMVGPGKNCTVAVECAPPANATSGSNQVGQLTCPYQYGVNQGSLNVPLTCTVK